ncbi:MAG: hypothetical protein AB1758_11395 [Candidatus Eremiobacterota bacterium]
MTTLETQPQTALEGMIEHFRSVLDRSPDDPNVLLGFAEANLRRGKRLEALTAFHRVLGVAPDVPDAHLGVAQIYYLHGLPLEAYAELCNVFELEPGRPEGFLLIHEMEGDYPVPDSLLRHRRFYPTEQQVSETRARLVLEREHLVREVDQLRAAGEGDSAEPVCAYHLEEARKRLTRVQQMLAGLENLPTRSQAEVWEPQPPPRPEPVSPIGEQAEAAQEEESQEESQTPVEVYRTPEPPAAEPAELLREPGPAEEEPSGTDAEDIESFFAGLEEVADEAPPEEPEATPETPAPPPSPEPAPASSQLLAFYEAASAPLKEAVEELLKTRGLTSIFVASADGHILVHSSRDSVSPERIGALAVEAQRCLTAFLPDPQYWALECDGGIVLMQQLDARHMLIAVGQAGASFAMIRLNLDKARPRLSEPLADAPTG